MRPAQSPATRLRVIPRPGRSEKPKPGTDGTITSNASAGSPPCAPGSARSGISASISTKELGQPWVMSSGIGAGPGPAAAQVDQVEPMPSTWARKCGTAFIARSAARQSKPLPQYSTSSRM